MQKYLKILEQQVQWIALGLAAIFLGYMVWGYVLHPPIVVNLGTGVTVEPGNVNETIAKGPIAAIERDIAHKNEEFRIAVPDLVTPWRGNLALVDARRLPPITPHNPNLPNDIGPGGVTPVVGVVAETLPELAAPIPVAINSLRTTVEFPQPKWVAPADNLQAKAPMMSDDKDIASMTFRIDMAKVHAAFNKALKGQPMEVFTTMFLQTVLSREEQMPDGTWGNRVVVPPLSIHEMVQYPGDFAKPTNALTFEDWAAKHIDEILHPTFYDVAAGAAPYVEPGTAAPAAPAAPVAPVAPTPVPDPKRAPAVRPKGPGGGFPAIPGATPPAGARRGAYAPQDADRPAQVYPQRPAAGGRPPAGMPGYPTPYPGMPGFGPRPGSPYGQPYPGMRPPTGGLFNPSQPGQTGGSIALDGPQPPPDVTVVAHDDTVQAGKTYRYTLVYRMLNSLYSSTVPVKNQKMHDQFALISPASAATGPLSIPERSELFVRSLKSTEAHFDVFVWKGKTTLKDVSSQPGDPVTPTTWMVADIRTDPKTRELYVLLIDSHGKLQRRDYKSDLNDPRYKTLQDEVKGAAAGPTARAN